MEMTEVKDRARTGDREISRQRINRFSQDSPERVWAVLKEAAGGGTDVKAGQESAEAVGPS